MTAIRQASNHPLIASDRIEGTLVRRPNGKKIGRIERLMINKASGGGDFAGGIAEHRAELMLYPNDIAEFFFDCTDASLRDVCPDAQDIREICNLDRAHSTFSKGN